MKLLKTNSNHPDFQKITQLFDAYLAEIDGDEKDFFAQYNQIYIENVLVCYEDETAVACGAFKEYEPTVAEIKRMFVLPEKRGKGIASIVLKTLEIWAQENGFQQTVLETSNQLTNAISLYQKSGYKVIPNYGPYVDVESSICMKKNLK